MADKKKEIIKIKKELTQIIQDKNIGVFTGNPLISNIIIKLRLLGVKIDISNVSYPQEPYNICFETCADIVRQIDEYLHPIRNWFINHIDVIISSVIGISALIVAIIAL